MDYKKIIKSRRTRFKILKYLRWVPDSIMLRLQYRIKFGFWPNFKHPKRYTEKLQLYKMRYHNPIMPKCVDKYDVRDYVEKKGLGYLLNKCYGIYDSPNEIEWDKLPQKFVAKKTTGGGGTDVVVVKDKSQCDKESLYSTFTRWTMPRRKYSSGREWAYTQLEKNRIIIEELLEDDTNPDGSIDDYKFICFNGKFRYMWIDKDRFIGHKRGFWNEKLEFMKGYTSEYAALDYPPKLPDNINEMIKIAETLSADFPHARIDLYNIKGKIYFGEITFYSSSGYADYEPDSFDTDLGNCFDISEFKY